MIAEDIQIKQRQDWFLISIIGGIVALVVAAVVVLLSGSNEKEFLPENSPENIVLNYFLAIEQGDYERAYGYLSPSLESYPEDVGRFADDVYDQWRCDQDELERSSFSVEWSDTHDDRATVEIEQSRFYESASIFSTGGSYTNQFRVRLVNEPAGWRIVDSDRCWSYEWNQSAETEDKNNESS